MVPFGADTTARFQRTAEEQFASQASCIVDRASLSLIAGEALYDLPSYCVNVKRITYKGWKVFPLPHRDLRQSFQSGTQQSRPYWYIFNNIGQRKIRFFPVPSEYVSRSYLNEVLQDTPVGYWRMNETSLPAVVDSSGNNLTGTFVNSPTIQQPGLLIGDPNKSIQFLQAFINSASITHTSKLNLGDSFTFEWLHNNSLSGGSAGICEKGTGSFRIRITSNKLRLMTGSTELAVSSNDFASSTTYHCAVVKVGSFIKIYVNGEDVTIPVTNVTLTSNSEPLILAYVPSANLCINGRMDEVAVYNYAVPQIRIKQHYRASIDTNASDTNLWGSAIPKKCIVEFYRLPDSINGPFIPPFIRQRLLLWYSNKRNYAMEGRTQDMKASVYFGEKYDMYHSFYTDLLDDLNNSPRNIVANTTTSRPYGFIPPPPLLPVDRFGYSVDDYNG